MEKKLDKLESKIDKLDEKLDNIDRTLAINTTSLSEHMKRTALLEKHVNDLPKKALTYISILGGIITVLSKIFHI